MFILLHTIIIRNHWKQSQSLLLLLLTSCYMKNSEFWENRWKNNEHKTQPLPMHTYRSWIDLNKSLIFHLLLRLQLIYFKLFSWSHDPFWNMCTQISVFVALPVCLFVVELSYSWNTITYHSQYIDFILRLSKILILRIIFLFPLRSPDINSAW